MHGPNARLAAARAVFEFEAEDALEQGGPLGSFLAVIFVVMSELLRQGPGDGFVLAVGFEITE